MKRKLQIISLLLIVIMCVAIIVACNNDETPDIPLPDDKPDEPNGGGEDITKPEGGNTVLNFTQDKISLVVSATADKIKFDISSLESQVGNKSVKVIATRAYQYFSADQQHGVSDSLVDEANARLVGYYVLGKTSSFEIDRYDGNLYDFIYSKYYIINDGKILKGPVYATQIASSSDVNPAFVNNSKKGILGEGLDIFKELNCSHVTLNIEVEQLIYPNEEYKDGQWIPVAADADAYEFTSNGEKYYFRKSWVDFYDNEVKKYYQQGAHVTAIVYAKTNAALVNDKFPRAFTYYPYSVQGTTTMGLNTSNSYGFGYFVAMMEFFAERYTRAGLPLGYVSNFVLGNEIDYQKDYNRMSENALPLETYMEEYSRLLRLANLAVKKYDKDITVTMPVTQAWAKPGYTGAYAPKEMIEWLNGKTKAEGDYDWGIAPHCYSIRLQTSDVAYFDTRNGANLITKNVDTSPKLTFTNFEILEQYLNRDALKYKGAARNVFLTESGVGTVEPTSDSLTLREQQQASSIAWSWYKVSQMDCVKSYSYYRMRDVGLANEVCNFGLAREDGTLRPSYQVWKYIDTQYSQRVANEYLPYFNYFKNGKKVEGFDSYAKTLDALGTGYFTDFSWQKATPVTVEPILEWDDVTNELVNVRFENASFLHDGQAHSLEQARNVPQGVTVEYDKPLSYTDVGSYVVTATFKKNGTIIGRRRATLTIGDLATNKSVYNSGEKIFVTVNTDGVKLEQNAWVGVYRKGDVPGEDNVTSYYYFYVNQQDKYYRTICLQDQTAHNSRPFDSGNYVLYYFLDAKFSKIQTKVEITVLPEGISSGTVDLSDVTFTSKEFNQDGGAHSIEAVGNLPNGVTVQYVGNSRTEAGTSQAVAIFKHNGVEIERRYAVIDILAGDFKRLKLDKISYEVGEPILITAYAPVDSEPQTWWVAIYLASVDSFGRNYIRWYYVNDANHVSGSEYNIKENFTEDELGPNSSYYHMPGAKYKAVLFRTSGYDQVEQVIEFEVTDSSLPTATLELAKTQFDKGEAVTVRLANPSKPELTYRVGLFVNNAELKAENAIYMMEIDRTTYEFNKEYNLLDPAFLNASKSHLVPLLARKYQIAVFVSGEVLSSCTQTIQIGTNEEQPATNALYTNKTEYDYGDSVYITAFSDCAMNGGGYWVALKPVSFGPYPVTTNTLAWYYVNCDGAEGSPIHRSGDTLNLYDAAWYDDYAEFRNPLPSGVYRLTITNGATDFASLEFTVKGDHYKPDPKYIDPNADPQPTAPDMSASADFSANKETYQLGESIWIKANLPDYASKTYWVACIQKNQSVDATSIYWWYIEASNCADPIRLQSQETSGGANNCVKDGVLQKGEYKLVIAFGGDAVKGDSGEYLTVNFKVV